MRQKKSSIDVNKKKNAFFFQILPVNRKGVVLIWIIVALVVAAAMAVVIMNMTSTSTFTQSRSDEATKAAYLAEAGSRYAFPVIKDNFNNPATAINLLNNQTLTLENGDQFSLTLAHDGVDTYTLTVTGIRPQTDTRIVKTYEVKEAPPSGDDDDDDDDDGVDALDTKEY